METEREELNVGEASIRNGFEERKARYVYSRYVGGVVVCGTNNRRSGGEFPVVRMWSQRRVDKGRPVAAFCRVWFNHYGSWMVACQSAKQSERIVWRIQEKQYLVVGELWVFERRAP